MAKLTVVTAGKKMLQSRAGHGFRVLPLSGGPGFEDSSAGAAKLLLSLSYWRLEVAALF